MRRRRTRVSVLLSVLLLVLLVPSASAKVERTAYTAFQFPMGFPGTVESFPFYPDCDDLGGTYQETPFPACVIEPGTVERPDHGRWTIRDMETLDGVLPTSDLSLAGYQKGTLNANLDASGNGPAWGTYTTFKWGEKDPVFSGTWNGKFENARLGGHFVGKGLGAYAGLHLTGDILTEDAEDGDGNVIGNVIGEIKQTGP